MQTNRAALFDPDLFEEIELLTELMVAALADQLHTVSWLKLDG